MKVLSNFTAMLLAVLFGVQPYFVAVADAQERRSPSILEFFGIRPAKPTVNIKRPVPKISPKVVNKKKSGGRKKTTVKSSGASPNVRAGVDGQPVIAPPAVPLVAEKLIDAKTVLVIGDFMAGGVADGLIQVFEAEPGVRIVSKSNGSSGFIRDDFYNWAVELPAIVAETKPSVIAVMIGTNDRQPLRFDGNKVAVRSLPWLAEYEKRVETFATALKAANVPVVWIGLPPFKQTSMSADMLALNDIYSKSTENISGSFVDIWEGFLDELGVFSINGFDYIGQPARLRASDGINLTTAGKRKVAFFAEKPLRLALGNVLAPSASAFDPFNLPGPNKPASSQVLSVTRLAPISLFDPAFDGKDELLGAVPSEGAQAPNSPAKALYVDGIAPKPLEGRVDAPNSVITR